MDYDLLVANLVVEENRLATFKSWVFDDDKPCSASRMAEAGFYFTGSEEEPDLVNCFLCDKALDGWEPEDDPWIEHVKHAKNCSFAQMQTPQKALTFEQFSELRKNYGLALIERLYEKEKKEYQLIFEDINNILNAFMEKANNTRSSRRH